MTKEEREKAIKNLEFSASMGIRPSREAFKVALEALEQKPCEDAISRKAVADIINRQRFGIDKISWDIIKEKLEALPSVTPTREHGEWIQEEYWSEGCGMGESYGHWYRCSKCGNRVKDGYKKCGLNFCSKCGADMRGTKLPYADKSGLEYADQPTLCSAT